MSAQLKQVHEHKSLVYIVFFGCARCGILADELLVPVKRSFAIAAPGAIELEALRSRGLHAVGLSMSDDVNGCCNYLQRPAPTVIPR